RSGGSVGFGGSAGPNPQLVSMIVSHLKTEGLFDQFRRDCLADVDTKPAYFPQLNKNQLRNSIRQLVLQSGMLEQGVDRIVAQVVDPKVHHSFRPQVERVVQKFLAEMKVKDEGDTGNSSKSSGKIREENRDTDSQKPSSVKARNCDHFGRICSRNLICATSKYIWEHLCECM
uniref:BOD1/SHG1 domain-containing protein n=1 Tax=Sinocyclocheilus anshuiensis TaxID=1608454 RepID=A0A671TA40_9TELE